MAEQYDVKRSNLQDVRKQASDGMNSISNRVGGPDDPSGYTGINMRWRNEWEPVQYYQGDVVRDGVYLMIANKDTTDSAAPQDNGVPAWDMPDVPTWANFAQTAVVGSGHSYVFSEAAYINSVRVWPPTTGAGIFYRLTTVLNGVYTSVDLLGMTAGQ